MNKKTAAKLVLTDFYHQPTQRFLASLTSAGIPYRHVNINYDGFMPNELMNPFAHLIGAEGLPDKDLHYNQVKVPEYDEIRNLDGSKAEILRGDRVVGYIYYAPHSWRLVREVVWLSRSGKPTIAYRYNRQGFKFAELLYDYEGKEVKTLYFNAEGKQVLTVDTASRVMLGENQIFPTLTDFVKDYLSNFLDGVDEILINSMSTPFFAVNQLPEINSSLYFQETIHKEIPGNMQQILAGKSSVKRILFENAREMAKVQHLSPENAVRIDYLGAIEKFTRENKFRPAALTVTRSDQILYDGTIAKVLSENNIKWTIAAPSEISDKLRTFASRHENVHVLEAISSKELSKLLSDNDIYLDLNQGGDWENAVQRAYLEGLLVITDLKTVKNAGYELILEKEQEIVDVLKRPDKNRALRVLREKKGKTATAADYQRLLK
ncbi:accessory Sec system glycosylation chaperone GtfB [Lactovum odontotermitis]